MPDYRFFAAMLQFVAGRTAVAEGDEHTRAMMDCLCAVAGQAAAGSRLVVAAPDLAITARAMAGFAGFLQQRILPEAVAHGNQGGETQVRWAIDTAMDVVNRLLSGAATAPDRDVAIDLPPAP